MPTRILHIIALVVLTVMLATSCNTKTPDEQRVVSVTILPQKYLAEQIAKAYGIRTVALAERRTFSVDENSFCAKLYDGERIYSSDKYRMRMVDRVGSGDAFAAGLLYALRHSFAPSDAIRFAAAASCLNHSIEGDYNILNVNEVLALAKGNASGMVQR